MKHAKQLEEFKGRSKAELAKLVVDDEQLEDPQAAKQPGAVAFVAAVAADDLRDLR